MFRFLLSILLEYFAGILTPSRMKASSIGRSDAEFDRKDIIV
jgi:hypothetical protein